jgi:hypothetical protein
MDGSILSSLAYDTYKFGQNQKEREKLFTQALLWVKNIKRKVEREA